MDQNLEMNKKKFFSKILLFGEYGIIKNSKALVIPYKNITVHSNFQVNLIMFKKIQISI